MDMKAQKTCWEGVKRGTRWRGGRGRERWSNTLGTDAAVMGGGGRRVGTTEGGRARGLDRLFCRCLAGRRPLRAKKWWTVKMGSARRL